MGQVPSVRPRLGVGQTPVQTGTLVALVGEGPVGAGGAGSRGEKDGRVPHVPEVGDTKTEFSVLRPVSLTVKGREWETREVGSRR